MIHVKVTRSDIKPENRSRSTQCPVARGIRRSIGRLRTGCKPLVVVGEKTVSIGLQVVDLPESVCSRVETFDYTGDMEPFEFDLTYEAPAR